MTELEIINRLVSWIDRNKFPYQTLRAFIYGWECDYWCMDKSGITREFEIKCSRSDFLIDAKKPKHGKEGANYFYYVCPAGMIKKDEVNSKYGLIYVPESEFDSCEVVKKPKQLHEKRFTDWQMLANKFHGKWWSLWVEKKNAQEITFQEYKDGFNMQLSEHETQNNQP